MRCAKALSPALEDVLRHMGYPQGNQAPERILTLLKSRLTSVLKTLRPMVYFTEHALEMDFESRALRLPGTDLSFDAQLPFEAFKDCDALILGVATVAREGLEAPEGVFEQLLVTAVEGALLEALTNDFWQDQVKAIQWLQSSGQDPRGLTSLIFPGENKWPLEDQRKIFEILQAAEPALEVHLNAASVMTPAASLSFVLGRTLDGSVSETHHDCTQCGIEFCAYRKAEKPKVKLTIHSEQGTQAHFVDQGTNLLEAVLLLGYAVDSPCGGNQTCGKCRGLVHKGAPEAGPQELKLLKGRQGDKEARLLCFIRADQALEVTLSSPERKAQIQVAGILKSQTSKGQPWFREVAVEVPKARERVSPDLVALLLEFVPEAERVSLTALGQLGSLIGAERTRLNALVFDREILEVVEASSAPKPMYGVAFDLGTTTLAAYLFDYRAQRVVETAGALNPQGVRGKDVMSRIQYVSQDPSGAKALRDLLVTALQGLLGKLILRQGIKSEALYHLVFTGNTTMLHLLLGIPCATMGVSPFTPVFLEAMTQSASGLDLNLNPQARMTLLPSKAAFVGADTVAALYAAGIHQSQKAQLLMDLGTNGEIVLSAKGQLLCCATAAGPAFEGGSISHGMGAVAGAIDRVNFEWPKKFTTLGGGPPIGLCGSGLVDLCAELLKNGKLTPQGRLLDRDDQDRFVLDPVTGLSISQKDIRELQLAKGAIHAAVEILMEQLSLAAEDVDTVYIAGGFGNYLDLKNAACLKLLPEGLMEKAQFLGNAAGIGALEALWSKEVLMEMREIRDRMTFVELSGMPAFQTAFVRRMGF